MLLVLLSAQLLLVPDGVIQLLGDLMLGKRGLKYKQSVAVDGEEVQQATVGGPSLSRFAFNVPPSVEVVTGQGCLSTSSPNPTEGVEESEELPMIGVKQGGNFGRFVSLLWPILSLIPPKHFFSTLQQSSQNSHPAKTDPYKILSSTTLGGGEDQENQM